METTIVAAIISVVGTLVASWTLRPKSSAEVDAAERAAFQEGPEQLAEQLRVQAESQETLQNDAIRLAELIDESYAALSFGRLANLYSKQIEQYQRQTLLRANFSFIIAMLAMMAGLGFVLWGGNWMIASKGTEQIAAGAAISTIGGAVSAFITKTFLGVHRLSLTQLNRYFRQPVVNDHILMAQRLADAVGDPDSKKASYEMVIRSISKLIEAEADGGDGGRQEPVKSSKAAKDPQ